MYLRGGHCVHLGVEHALTLAVRHRLQVPAGSQRLYLRGEFLEGQCDFVEPVAVPAFDLGEALLALGPEALVPVPRRAFGTEDCGECCVVFLGVADLDLGEAIVERSELRLLSEQRRI